MRKLVFCTHDPQATTTDGAICAQWKIHLNGKLEQILVQTNNRHKPSNFPEKFCEWFINHFYPINPLSDNDLVNPIP